MEWLEKAPPRNLSHTSLTTKTVRAKDLYRVSRYASGEPYFGKTASNRFDDRSKTDEMPVKGTFSIAYTEIDSRYLVRFKRDSLVLANLTGIPLKRLGGHGSLSTIIPYDLPQLWAMAVHRHPQYVDGTNRLPQTLYRTITLTLALTVPPRPLTDKV